VTRGVRGNCRERNFRFGGGNSSGKDQIRAEPAGSDYTTVFFFFFWSRVHGGFDANARAYYYYGDLSSSSLLLGRSTCSFE